MRGSSLQSRSPSHPSVADAQGHLVLAVLAGTCHPGDCATCKPAFFFFLGEKF